MKMITIKKIILLQSQLSKKLLLNGDSLWTELLANWLANIQPESPSATSRNTSREPDETNDALNSNYNDDQPKTNRKIIVAGDSLLHRIK